MENKKILYYEQLDSTNTKLIELAKEAAEHGTVVVADKQTAGKGRRGRNWESPEGENLYMSLLLRPDILPEKAPMLTLVMAYSVAKVVRDLGFSDVKIKWPNDLVLSGKKICGILTEMQLRGQHIDSVIIGVGVNINTTSFSEEIKDKATSLFLESGEKYNREQLIEAILENFAQDYDRFVEIQNLSFLQEEYNGMLINCGREVIIQEPEKKYTAWACGINKNGELLVETEDGRKEAIYAGEVSVRGLYGYV